MAEVAEEYRSSLAELNFNSKPHINMLTMLAEENVKHAPSIVQTIIEHIKSVSPDMMLPCMYLIDSIIKNIGNVYIQLFSKHLVAIFTSVFEKVDETIRSALYKLRSTWSGIFPNSLMLRLDKSVVQLDPAWPILAQPPAATKIHVNPKFLDKPPATQLPKKEQPPSPTTQSALLQEADAIKKKQLEVLQVLQAKKKQLMELKKKAQASGVVEYLGSDVQKALNARDPRLSKKAVTIDVPTPPLQSVVVVPKPPQPIPAKMDDVKKDRVSPEPKRLKTESADVVLKEDLRNKLNDIKNSTEIVEKNLSNDSMIVHSNQNKRKLSVSSDSHNVHPSKVINNKIKVPVLESDTLQSKTKNTDLSNQSLNHIVPKTEIPTNVKQKEDMYSKNKGIQPTPAPVLFGSEDKDYRTIMIPKQDPDERIAKELSFPKRMPIPVVKSFKLDNKDRKVYFVNDRCFVVMEDNIPRELSFDGPPKLIFVEGLSKPFELGFRGHEVKFDIDGKWNTIKFGTPAREVYINCYPCEAQFGGQPLSVVLENGKLHRIHISGPPPQVILSEKPAYELYEKFCQSNQDFLRRYSSLPEINPEVQSASRDIDMRVISNPFPQPPVFNFPLEKVNDVDWQRMPVGDSSQQSAWNAAQNAFETVKNVNHGLVPIQSFPDVAPNWPMPVPDIQNQMPAALAPPVPPKELLDRFPLGSCPTTNSELPGPIPVSNPQPFPPPNFNMPPQNPQINKVQLSNTPRLSPPPLPPFLPPVPSSAPMPAPFVNTVVTAPVSMTNMQPPIHTPNLRAPRPCLLPTPVNTLPNPMPMQNMPNHLQMNNSMHMTSLPPPLPPNPVQVQSSFSVPPPPTTTAAPPVNMDVFLKRLIDAGIIGKKEGTPPPESKEDVIKKEVVKRVEPIPKIRLHPKYLKQYHPGVISMLHIGSQCATCGMRFKEIQSEQYSRHLDWHFRMNRREKDGAKKPYSRRLFYEIKDWIQFKEFEEKNERAPSYFELQASGEPANEEKPETVCSVPSSECESENCAVCGEQFQLFWVEDEEEWHLRNAVKHTDQVYHPACYEDYKKAQNESMNQDLDTSADEATAKVELDKLEEEPEKMDIENKELDQDTKDDITMKQEDITIKQEPEEVKPEKTEPDTDTITIKEEPMDTEAVVTNETTDEANVVETEIDMNVDVINEEKAEEAKLEETKSDDNKAEDSSKPEKSDDNKSEDSSKTEKSEGSKEESKPVEPVPVVKADEEEEIEFRPPTPDPRFEVLEPVMRGTELSALCTIM